MLVRVAGADWRGEVLGAGGLHVLCCTVLCSRWRTTHSCTWALFDASLQVEFAPLAPSKCCRAPRFASDWRTLAATRGRHRLARALLGAHVLYAQGERSAITARWHLSVGHSTGTLPTTPREDGSLVGEDSLLYS